jgi:uncharacterized protein (TIGR02145 family)
LDDYFYLDSLNLHPMRKFVFFAVLLIPLFFTLCKKDSSSGNTPPSLLEVQTVITQTHDKFYESAARTNGDPRKALMLTRDWVITQATVAGAEVLDSTYLRILLKSGILTTYCYSQTDKDGFCIFRGSKAGGSGALARLGGHGCKNAVENKKVLIFAAGYSEFYTPGELQPLMDMIGAAGTDYEVTLMKDAQCDIGMIDTFGDYGLVIIDTHGTPDGFMLGTKIWFATLPVTEEELKNAIIQQAGQKVYDMILSGDIGYVNDNHGVGEDLTQWFNNKPPVGAMKLFVTSKFINSRALWSGTVILGNMCYSADNITRDPKFFSSPPIRTAFMNRDVISYYGYSKDDNSSKPVTDQFSKEMEDSLVRSFLVDGDSTAVAHLKSDNTEYNDYLYTTLKLKHFNYDNYCFGRCGDDYIDIRDGKTYQTICIGKQVWMAQNLNYAAPGSICYSESVGNCVTFGRLYDWNTVMDGHPATNKNPSGVQGVCPPGWHVPSLSEWFQLIDFAGGTFVAGGMLKETSIWNSPNTGATDAFSFSALPGGYRDTTGVFKNLGNYGHWWTTRDSASINKKWFIVLSSVNSIAGGSTIAGGNAMSVRCVKN